MERAPGRPRVQRSDGAAARACDQSASAAPRGPSAGGATGGLDAGLDGAVEHLLPGRPEEIRPMTAQERKATGAAAPDVEAVTMKRRVGPPLDDAEDIAAGGWAGVPPVAQAIGRGVGDAHTPFGAAEPPSLAAARAKCA